MPVQYLLPCACGRKTPVETRQAGETITCDCGAKLEIPRLLELKKLEKSDALLMEAPAPFVWGIGHSLIISGLVVLLLVAGLWYLVLNNQHDPYAGMTPEQIQAVNSKMSPLDTWKRWQYFEQGGLNPHKNRMERYFVSLFEQSKMYLVFLGIAAGVGVVLIVVGSILAFRKGIRRSTATS